MPSALTETELIFSALHLQQTLPVWQADCERASVNWDSLAVRAIVLGLAPALHARLTEWQMTTPPKVMAKLGVTRQMHAQRNTAIYAQLGEALTAFAERSLYPIALKGVHLAAAVYPDLALRPMNDIDLLFKPEELPTAEAVLETLGYGGKHKSAELGPGVTKHTSTFQRAGAQAATPNPYLSGGAERMIEPHGSLEESWFGLKVDITPGVRERAVKANLGGHSCQVLAQEDLLLHLCVHFSFHLIMGSPAMVQLLDLRYVTTGEVDWDVFVRRALDRSAAPFGLAALTLAHHLLGAPVPERTLNILATASPEAHRRRVATMTLADVLQHTQQKPLQGLVQRLQRGVTDRAEAARWAGNWRGQWQVWRTALEVGRTDTARLMLRQIVAKGPKA
jgi:putative nucleotidyltransferase-like protein